MPTASSHRQLIAGIKLDLKTWDQEISSIHQGLTQAERIMATSLTGPAKAISRLKTLIHRERDCITQNLEKIVYLGSPNTPFPAFDKGLLYWATQYSTRAQKLLREADKKTILGMWLKLVQHRIVGHGSSMRWSVLKFGENAIFLNAQRKKVFKAEAELLDRLGSITTDRAALTERYNCLILTRANRDAAGCLQANFGDGPTVAMKHPVLENLSRLLLNASLRIRKVNRRQFAQTAEKLDQLTHFIESPVENQKATPTRTLKTKDTELESFNKLSDHLMGINPLRDAAITQLDRLQTKRANREASEINLSIPIIRALPRGQRAPVQRIGRIASLSRNN
jgi:hypothetical protein